MDILEGDDARKLLRKQNPDARCKDDLRALVEPCGATGMTAIWYRRAFGLTGLASRDRPAEPPIR